MAATPNSKQVLLHVEQITAIRTNHAPTADAITQIVNYINAHVVPKQGTKVLPK